MEERLLSDETVWLSPPTAADTDTIVECCQDPAIAAWVTIPVPYHREHAEQFLDEFVTRGWAADNPTWALRLQADGPVIGMIALGAVDESAREIGFWLVPEHRERGLMSRAITLVCNFGFDPDGMALARITWHAFVGNHAPRRRSAAMVFAMRAWPGSAACSAVSAATAGLPPASPPIHRVMRTAGRRASDPSIGRRSIRLTRESGPPAAATS